LFTNDEEEKPVNEMFRRFATSAADALGSPTMFVANVLLILGWLAMGPMARYSDTWQLWVNTVTTVFTYLAVFLIQNTQNRDAKAVHLKLDELISSTEGARNRMVNLQELSDQELKLLQEQFQRLKGTTAHRDAQAIKGEPDDDGSAE
jgi:low affinity Fe/Cu permease